MKVLRKLRSSMQPVKIYTGLTLAYGAFTAWRRDYYPGLAVTSVMAAPFAWPCFLMEDYLEMQRRTFTNQGYGQSGEP